MAPAERLLDLQSHEVLGIVQPAGVAGIEPILPDHDEHHIAPVQRVVRHPREVRTALDVFDIHEDMLVAEASVESVAEPPCVSARVLAVLADEDVVHGGSPCAGHVPRVLHRLRSAGRTSLDEGWRAPIRAYRCRAVIPSPPVRARRRFAAGGAKTHRVHHIANGVFHESCERLRGAHADPTADRTFCVTKSSVSKSLPRQPGALHRMIIRPVNNNRQRRGVEPGCTGEQHVWPEQHTSRRA